MNRLLSLRVFGAIAFFGFAAPLLSAGPKIGVLLKGHSAFWSAVEKDALQAGQAAGADVIVKQPPAETDILIQVQLLNGMLTQGIDALVVAPSSKDALAAPVAAAIAKGVKVVVIDSVIEGEMPVFIGTNQADAGAAAGRLVATLITENDEVSFLRHSQNSGATTVREAGAFTALREAFPKLVVHRDIFSSTEPGAEPQKARLLLAQHPKTKVVLASSTTGTLAMLRTLQEKQLAGSIKLVGFGFNLTPEVAAAIEQGAMDGWIAQLPGVVGQKAVEAAVALLKGETVPPKIYCDFLVVTKANLHEPQVQALLPR